MKSSFLVLICFSVGILLGLFANETPDFIHSVPTVALYLLIAQVGLNLGAHNDVRSIFHGTSARSLTLPFFTVAGTLLFTAIAWFLFAGLNFADCMALGSGFAYYSLSSMLIMEFKTASSGIEIATELASIALLANMIREMLALLGGAFFARYFGKYATITAAGINSMDVCMPTITRFSGSEVTGLALFHGIVLELSVPLLISLFCSM